VRKARHVAPPELDRLELAVRRLLEANDTLRRRLAETESRATELHSAVRDFATGGVDPMELTTRAASLEAENEALRERLHQARESVQRMLNRLQFVEEER
jgi:chromosome segregation ATPase